MVDYARDYAHTTTIYPFADQPNQGVPVLVWPVPLTTPSVLFASPYVLRNWDRLEQQEVPTFGMRYAPKVYYTGPLPINRPGTPCGTRDQWQGPLLYSVYVADGYHCDCPPIEFPVAPAYSDSLDGRKACTPGIDETYSIIPPPPTYSESLDAVKAITPDIVEM